MNTVYLLQHSYEVSDQEEAKLIGQVVRCRPVSSDDPRLLVYEQA